MLNVCVFLIQMTFWLLLSGHYSLPGYGGSWMMIFSLGVMSSLLVTYLAARMRVIDDDSVPVRRIIPLLTYIPWLLWEILLSNIDVAWRVWHPDLPISPRFVKVPYRTRTPFGATVYANSITLTPGTVTILVEDDHFLVHALTEDAAAALEGGEMHRRVRAVEGTAPEADDGASPDDAAS